MTGNNNHGYRLTSMAAFLACGLVAACTTADSLGEDRAPAPGEELALEQLELSQQALADKGLPLRIVDYTAAAPLDTDDAVRDAHARILDGSALVPTFDGVNASSLSLATIDARMQAFRAGVDQQDVVANLQAIALPMVTVGQHAMDVTWESGGQQFQSKLVFDENGVVYDNLLSNIVFVEDESPAAELPPAAPAGEVVAAFANQSFSTRFLNYTIKWIWGSTRGKIELTHYVISCDNWVSFCDQGGSANAWMTTGSATGKTAKNALKKPRISKRAWGYGWATPTASFSVSWNSGSLTFSASTSGVGSAGKGVGVHTIY